MGAETIAYWSAILAVVAAFISLYAVHVTRTVATSGFQSAERVKSDTAGLLAALRSLMVKGALYTQQDSKQRDDASSPGFIDIKPERAVIQMFLCSPTAIAYHSFAADKGREATESGKRSEPWRAFGLQLAGVLQGGNPMSAALQAARLEKLLDGVTDDQLTAISANLEDLPGAIDKLRRARPHDVLTQVLFSMEDDSPHHVLPQFVEFLREQGVDDPEVDLLWASSTGRVDVAQEALKRGASVNVDAKTIIARHRALWDKFQVILR